jgi:hypothetical protein
VSVAASEAFSVPDVASLFVSAFVMSRLDYCNVVLAGLPQHTITPLQRVENAAARLVKGLGIRDHLTSALCDLHWLPVLRHVGDDPKPVEFQIMSNCVY